MRSFITFPVRHCDEAVHPSFPRFYLQRLPCRALSALGREEIEWQGGFPLYAIFFYSDDLLKLLVSMKFSGRTDRARALAPLMAHTVRRHHLGADAIIPVPLHRRRKAERGYNQVSVLAECLSEAIDVPAVEGLLISHHYTERQSEAHLVNERQLHLQNAFSMDPACPLSSPSSSLQGAPRIPSSMICADDRRDHMELRGSAWHGIR